MKRKINFLLVLSLAVLTSCSDSTWNDTPDEPIEPDNTIVNLCSPYIWTLASTPADQLLFPEAFFSNDVEYGKNRALLSWYTVDRLFTQRNSSYAPGYIKSDMDALSYPYAREVAINEVFPGHELNYGESHVIQTLNLSFYPRERGPYNLDATNVDQDGNLLYPERRWGGIMCKMDNTNLEQSDVKYIQFWLLDPFMDPDLDNQNGGKLYFNLGEISEDVLKDGLMSYENRLPNDGGTTYVTNTVWGKVSTKPNLTNAFDKSDAARLLQDVGLDGLTNDEEKVYPTYANFLNKLRTVLPPSTITTMMNDPFSPFNDPAGDNYAFYRSTYYDQQRYSIIGRYKHYNGTDGNSLPKVYAGDAMYEMARSTPDMEDVNQDNTLNEEERYFQYCVSIHPDSLRVGTNYITDIREANVHTRNGQIQHAVWYQFTIPLQDYEKTVGSIQGFSRIRFMRIYLTGFRGITHLRFATLGLVAGE